GPLWGRLLGGSAAGAPPSCTSDRCLQPHRAPTLGQGQAPKRPHGDPRRTVEGVSDLLIACQTATPNSYRLINSPITKSCMRSVLEKQIVRRTNRLIRVRKLMCLLSIFCVCAFPTVCCSASTCRS